MSVKGNNILITGYPGVGKTTLIKRLSESLQQMHPVGFFTREIRQGGIRKGFELESFGGQKSILSHVAIRSRARVGKYGVDVAAFDVFLDSIGLPDTAGNIVIIDEIGKMECFSEKFRRLVTDLLDSHRTVVATIAAKGGGLIAQIKDRPDVTMLEVTVRNRDILWQEISGMILPDDCKPR